MQHQWTGNLVTCTWWDELWINEAFADLGGYLGLRYAEPEWNWKNEFLVGEVYTGLRADDYIDSRPIINKQNNNGFKVDQPSTIGRQFDLITYQKGGSILLMVMQAMTEKRWQYGMQIYLNEQKFTSTDGEIYFSYMQRAVEEVALDDKKWELPYTEYNAEGLSPYNQTFDCWFRQMGYPVIHVQYGNAAISLTQSRYLHSGTEDVIDAVFIGRTHFCTKNLRI